jgi:ATPases of the AAA+ class
MQAKSVIEAIVHADVAEKLGAKRVRGIFIEGPRGNGKTLLVNIIATELNAKVMTVNAASLGHDFEGELEFIFRKAQEKAKRERIVLLFDHVENLQREEQFNAILKQLEHVTEKILLLLEK